MNLDVEKIKQFLNDKQSYLKCGNQRISDALDVRYNCKNAFSFDDIKRAKKEVKKDLKAFNKKEQSDTDQMKKQLEEMAQKLGMTLYPTVENSEEGLLKKKKHINAIVTPSLADQVGMHIVLGCNHVPFHNKRMHEGILELMQDYKNEIKGFHLIGDFLDLNTLSSHDRGKFTAVPGLTLDEEYEAGNRVLDEYDAILGRKVWKTYLYGNHEDRYNRWMKNMDNAKTPLGSPEDELNLWKRGYNVKTNWNTDFFTLGKFLDIFHGIYFNVHCAKKHLDVFRGSCMFVHTHRTQTYIEGNTASYNIGACADFSSKAFNYASRGMKSQWSNGFAIVHIDDSGHYYVTQVPVQNGKFFFGGKEY